MSRVEETLSIEEMEQNIRICPKCGKKVPREDMAFSRDCHGIAFRLLCIPCLEKIEETIGYDGEYYTEADECLDYDY
jgi:NADH pyrophosphatase NudC (nudix superfamily)